MKQKSNRDFNKFFEAEIRNMLHFTETLAYIKKIPEAYKEEYEKLLEFYRELQKEGESLQYRRSCDEDDD